MTTILLSDLHGPEIADATSLSTFIRTIGASFASSLTSWIWSRNAGVHHSILAEQISPYNPQVAPALHHGDTLSLLAQWNGIITSQSFMMSTIDLFSILTILFAVLVPLIFLTRKAVKTP